MSNSTASSSTPAESVPVFTSWRRFTWAIASSPLLALERPAGQEQEEQGAREIENQPAGVDDAVGELVDVVPDVGEIQRLLDQVARRKLAEQADQEEQQEHGDRAHRRRELAARHRGGEDADGEKQRADQHEAEIAGGYRPPV